MHKHAVWIIAVLLCLHPEAADCQQPVAAGMAQTVSLEQETPAWSTVISGEAICAPQQTSYGFSVITDGRTLLAFSDRGTLLWQRALRGKPQPFYTVNTEDFFYIVTNSTRLNLVNPSGTILWTVDTGFNITAAPVEGKDGRIFVQGRDYIACYGINGIRKWLIRTAPIAERRLCPLPDGSLLAFFAGQLLVSQVLRISPFGQELESFALPHTVAEVLPFDKGVFFAYAGGSAAVYTLQKIKGRTALSLQALWSKDNLLAHAIESKTLLYNLETKAWGACAAALIPDGNSLHMSVISLADGKTVTQAALNNIDANRLIYTKATEDGIMAADSRNALLCQFLQEPSAQTITPIIKWQAKLPMQKTTGWNRLYYSSYGTLVLCNRSWELEGYRMMQDVQQHTAGRQPGGTKTAQNYTEYYRAAPKDGPTAGADILQQGDYGTKELAWVNSLSAELDAYYQNAITKTTNVRDISFIQQEKAGWLDLISTAVLFGTNVFEKRLMTIALTEQDNNYRRLIIRIIGNCAYDPDGKLLDTIDTLLYRIPVQQIEETQAVCDAVYSICRFMGRRAFYRRGRDMLSRLLTSAYPQQTAEYAKKTLLLIATLDTSAK